MPMDPISFWMQSSVFWARMFKLQHDTYLEVLCRLTAALPHPSAQELSAQAQAAAQNVIPVTVARAKRAERPATRALPEPVTA